MKITFTNLHRPKKGVTATVALDGRDTWHLEAQMTPQGPFVKHLRPLKHGEGRKALDGEMEKVRVALVEELARRDLSKRLEGRAVFVRDGKVCEIKLHNGDSLAETRRYLKSKYPKAVLLNDLDAGEALALYRKHKG